MIVEITTALMPHSGYICHPTGESWLPLAERKTATELRKRKADQIQGGSKLER